MLQLLCHILGDYWLQSDWIALNKSKKTFPCLVHCFLYTCCFLLLTISWKALLFIFVTHFLIDRFPIIIKRLIWLKNHIGPKFEYPIFGFCNTTGYFDDSPYNTCKLNTERNNETPRPFFITVWLYIISDNFLHLTCNYLALTYLQ